MECPVCKKDFNEKTGRRPKKFCSDECKVKFWNAKKKGETLVVKIKDNGTSNSITWGKRHDGIEAALPTGTSKIITDAERARIAELEAELKSPPKNPQIGLKLWTKLREKELSELKRQLK